MISTAVIGIDRHLEYQIKPLGHKKNFVKLNRNYRVSTALTCAVAIVHA